VRLLLWKRKGGMGSERREETSEGLLLKKRRVASREGETFLLREKQFSRKGKKEIKHRKGEAAVMATA